MIVNTKLNTSLKWRFYINHSNIFNWDKFNFNRKRLDSLKKFMSTTGQEKLEDFKAKVQVLIEYKYIDFDMNL